MSNSNNPTTILDVLAKDNLNRLFSQLEEELPEISNVVIIVEKLDRDIEVIYGAPVNLHLFEKARKLVIANEIARYDESHPELQGGGQVKC
jgi:hypothetical protein